jgi:hypothetical protein
MFRSIGSRLQQCLDPFGSGGNEMGPGIGNAHGTCNDNKTEHQQRHDPVPQPETAVLGQAGTNE